MRGRLVLLFMSIALLSTGLLPVTAPDRAAERCFRFSYVAEIPVAENAGEVRIWLPYPVSDAHQEISDVRVNAPSKTELRRESKYGNSVLYFVVERPKAPVRVEMSFQVKRYEYVHRPGGQVPKHASSPVDAKASLWLKPDRLVPDDPRIMALAEEIARGKRADLQKARAIYDYTVATMKYDKSGTGWGNGDIFWACDNKRGNCTDFHSLFIGLCRAVGIPARFSIGFPIPEQRGEGEIGGYHCWAEFYLEGYGWVPVDASEACKNPEKREYFFGAHDANRVQITQGRDLRLDPPQVGDPLNYFIYPYVELDGKPLRDVKKRFTYKDLRNGSTQGSRSFRDRILRSAPAGHLSSSSTRARTRPRIAHLSSLPCPRPDWRVELGIRCPA